MQESHELVIERKKEKMSQDRERWLCNEQPTQGGATSSASTPSLQLKQHLTYVSINQPQPKTSKNQKFR